MKSASGSIALALVLASVVGCGEAGEKASGGIYERMLAGTATRECLRSKASAPDAAYADKIQQVCDCTKDKIIAAQPGPLEPEDSRRRKLRDALDSCVAELGLPS
jgi:hypothetical protein